MKRLSIIGLLIGLASQTFAQTYADHSALSQGRWVRMAITQDGPYELDAAFLQEAGFDVGSLDPRQIRMFGRPGGMLPQANDVERPDDMPELAIVVTGEGDGVFNSGDRVLFFAQGAHGLTYNSESEQYAHEYNLYSDTSYYYLTVGPGNGMRVEEAADPGPSTFTSESNRAIFWHEVERENLLKSGRFWLGEKFDLTLQRTYAYPLISPNSDGNVWVRLNVAAMSDVNTSFDISVNGVVAGSVALNAVNIGNTETRRFWTKQGIFSIPVSSLNATDSIRVTLTYKKSGSSRSEGWLDWLEVEYGASYNVAGRDRAYFTRADKQAGMGEVASISVSGLTNNYRLWDLTNPLKPVSVPFTANGSSATASIAAETANGQLLAFRSPLSVSSSPEVVANQDLHGLSLVDYLIITPPQFREQANRLATFHQDFYGRSTAVVTPQQIFEEFSAGRQDVSAIRDFIRMFWVRSNGVSPGFVMLFGDGGYIYKYFNQNVNNNTNFIPTYQSRDSWEPTDSYTSDDFFVMLEEDEGFWGENSGVPGDSKVEVASLDAAIGRLPIESVEEAEQIVTKIIEYATNPTSDHFGDWRNRIVLVADHKEGEGNTHVRQANGYTSQIRDANPCFNVDKIYMDNYQMVLSGGLTRFPEGRDALLTAFDEGALIVNYTGHGGEQAWSNSRILENSDILKMKNTYRTPAVVTATCEFGRFDDPTVRSGAEIMVMTPEVGAIALFTTVRLVYSSPNQTLNQNFYREIFSFDSTASRMPTIGEAMYRTKNRTFQSGTLANLNSRNFTLLGDPGLILNYPKLEGRITHINGAAIQPGQLDSLKSLGRYEMSGIITDEAGNPRPDFNGEMDITVYDKPSLFTTRLSNYSFTWQKNRIFNGRCTVKDGEFSFEFVVPIDISYEDGSGKISLYFHNEVIDGAGCYEDLYVGGTDAAAQVDDEGPEVDLFINDESWVGGGMTDANPYLFARVFDDIGINTAGSGIGHEISAVLDGDQANTFLLNEFYEADLDDFRSGTVRYLLRDLELGEHTLSIRVWDVANNPSEAQTTFIVTDNARLVIDQILNYPNPVINQTNFLVAHNQAGAELELKIDILDMRGALVQQLSSEFTASGNVSRDLEWDGTDQNGRQLSDGFYVYRVVLTNKSTGEEVTAAKRLVLVRP